MRTKSIVSVLSFALIFQAMGAQAYQLGNFDLGGSISVGGQLSNGAGETSAQATTYRDGKRRFAVLDNLSYGANSAEYYMDLSASQIGYKDQSYSLSGGSYGSFDYNLFYDSIVHNYSFGAKTFWTESTMGTGTLSYDRTLVGNSPSNMALWPTTFDYATTAKNFGFNTRYGKSGPWFVNVGVNRVNTSGLRPSSTNGNNRFNFFEFADPIDYVTTNVATSGGIRGDDYLVALEANYSKFDNSIESMIISQLPNFDGTKEPDYVSMNPDNKYWKVGTKASWFRLPFDSTVNASVSYSKITNTVALPSRMAKSATVSGAAVDLTGKVNTNEFKGDLSYGVANLAVTSAPVEKMTSKLYYTFMKKWNKSTEVTYDDPAVTTDDAQTNHLFNYYKHNAGADLGYKLPFSTKLGAGYEYLNIHRHRYDAQSTKDHNLYLTAKNNALDLLGVNFKYKYLSRKGEADPLKIAEWSAAGSADSSYISLFAKFRDATSKKQHRVSLGLDLEPVEHLSLALEGAYRTAKYNEDEVFLGRASDRGTEAYADASYQVGGLFTLSAYGHYERTLVLSKGWRQNGSTGPYDPGLPAADNNFYHTASELTDDLFGYGLGINVPLMEKRVNVDFGWGVQRSSGKVTFTNDRPTADNPGAIDLYDDYLKNTLTAKTRYQITDNIGATIGYQYELFKYEDAGMEGYKFVQGTSNQSYLSGLNNDNDYKAHTGYLLAEYRF